MIERIDQFGFHETLESTSGLALVVFTGPACGSCRAVKLALEAYSRERPAREAP
ncbi:MAG: hypothetical protein ABFS23_04275 [Pseudomonadota bacterium]